MKKLLTIGLLLCFILQVMAQNTTEPKPLVFSPEKIVAGEELTITYHPELTVLKGEKNVEGVIYYWRNYLWEAEDLNLSAQGNALKATVKLPQNVALVMCTFYAGGKKDIGTENLLYTSFVYDKKGVVMPSANIGWGLLRGVSTRAYAGNKALASDSIRTISDDVVMFWVRNELKYHPQEQRNLFWYAAKVLNDEGKAKDNPGVKNTPAWLEQEDKKNPLTEDILLKELDVVNNILQDSAKAASIETEILKRFPDGIMARDKEIWRMFRISNADKQTEEFPSFLKRFPPEKFVNAQGDDMCRYYYGQLFRTVIYNEIVKHQKYDLLMKYLHVAPFEMLTTFYWHLVQIPFNNKQQKSDVLYPYACAIYNERKSRPRTDNDLYLSPKQWKEQFYSGWKDAVLVHAQLKNDCGDPKGAMALLDTIAPAFGKASADFNSFYVKMLSVNGRQNEVIPYIKASVKENAASPEMLDVLKKDYVAQKGNEDGFDAYLTGLKSATGLEAQRQEVLKELIRKPIQLFKVETLDGKTVDMRQMKGKTIVLDFWATWCAPCKAAMPGMQLAVNRYKDDPNVVFLFVSTMEYDPKYKEKIHAFLKEKGFTFTVVLDNLNPATKKRDLVYSTYAKAFGFSGIPQKLIIDGNGNLRWRATGYNGSPSALADEIGFVIDYLKNEK